MATTLHVPADAFDGCESTQADDLLENGSDVEVPVDVVIRDQTGSPRVTIEVKSHGAGPNASMGTATPEPDLASLAKSLERAMGAAARIRAISRQVHLEPDVFLALLQDTVATQGEPRPSADFFTSGEVDALNASNVDLTGPALPRATLRTAVASANQLGSALTVAEAASRLAVSPGRIRQRLAEGTLYGIRSGPGSAWRLPMWQFTENGVLPGLDRILVAGGDHLHPLALERFMTAANCELLIADEAVSPVAWLRAHGDADAVADLLRHSPALP